MDRVEYNLKIREVVALERIADVLEKWAKPSGYMSGDPSKPGPVAR